MNPEHAYRLLQTWGQLTEHDRHAIARLIANMDTEIASLRRGQGKYEGKET